MMRQTNKSNPSSIGGSCRNLCDPPDAAMRWHHAIRWRQSINPDYITSEWNGENGRLRVPIESSMAHYFNDGWRVSIVFTHRNMQTGKCNFFDSNGLLAYVVIIDHSSTSLPGPSPSPASKKQKKKSKKKKKNKKRGEIHLKGRKC